MDKLTYPQKQKPIYRSQQPVALAIPWKSIFPGINIGLLYYKFLVLLASLFFVVTSSKGQGACPGSNCTSGDMTIIKVELVDALTLGPLPNTCIPGQENVSVKLKVTFDATANKRYGFLIIGDLVIDGQPGGRISQCYPEDFIQGQHTRILDQVISWPCGSTLSLVNVYTAWDNQAPSTTVCSFLMPDGSISNCGAIDPKCRYYAGQSFTVAAPLVANFVYSGSCPGNTLYQPITFSSPATGTGSSTGGNKPYQYSWEIKDAVTNAVLATSGSNPYTYTPVSANNLLVTLTVTDASSPQANMDTETKTVAVTSCCTPPTITSQPAAEEKCHGSAASFSVAQTGGSPAPTIQWEVSPDNGNNWSPISNNAIYNLSGLTLNISAVTYSMNGYLYRATLQSGACASVQSNSAALTVNPSSVGGTVAAPQTICYGSQPSSNLALSGNTGAVVKWQRSNSADFTSGLSDIANTSSTLSSSAIGALYQDTWFRAVVKSGLCAEANSSAVKISVDPTSVGGTVGNAQTICYNHTLNSNLSLTGHVGNVLSWQRSISADFNSGVTTIANTSTTLTIAAVGQLTQDTWFRAIVQSGQCTAASSIPVKITVNPTSVGGSVSAPQTICSGNSLNSNLALSGHTGSILRWERSTTSNFSSGVSTINNTSATLTIGTVGALTQDTWFRAIVKSGVCAETNSDAVKITIQQLIGNNSIAESQIICSGSTPAGLTGSVATGGNGVPTYQWQSRTTGNFADIAGAIAKDYAPGVIWQTTQFRRIATAGSACASHTSSIVTISISPESTIYPITGSNYCASAPNTGTITLTGSYPGVSYQLKKLSDNSDVQAPQTGTGTALTWSGLEAGTYYVWGTGIAPNYCTSRTANARVIVFDCSVLYTLTQGYYGGKNGKSCLGTNPVNTIKFLLGTTDLTIGTTKYIRIPATEQGAIRLNQAMPGGSTATTLPGGAACIITDPCFSYPDFLTRQGKINNILLSQTITLGLNARWNDGELLLFPIRSGYLTTQKMSGCGPDATVVEECENNTVSSLLMNQNVVDYLGATGTVGDLFALANEVLGGTKEPGINGVPSYEDINDAINTINKSFDEGRRFLDYYPEKQTCEMLFPAPILADPLFTTTMAREAENPITVTAYPNPFTDNVNFVVESKVSGQGVLEVYSMTGQKISTVYQGYFTAGKRQFQLQVPGHHRAQLMYVLKVGSKQAVGKLLQVSGR